MTLPKCYDGKRHRWQKLHRVTRKPIHFMAGRPHPSELWCQRCGKWQDDLLKGATDDR
jgi:hypothetical protein